MRKETDNFLGVEKNRWYWLRPEKYEEKGRYDTTLVERREKEKKRDEVKMEKLTIEIVNTDSFLEGGKKKERDGRDELRVTEGRSTATTTGKEFHSIKSKKGSTFTEIAEETAAWYERKKGEA